jgi:hypothetical protein
MQVGRSSIAAQTHRVVTETRKKLPVVIVDQADIVNDLCMDLGAGRDPRTWRAATHAPGGPALGVLIRWQRR